jgi:hypothetical protein
MVTFLWPWIDDKMLWLGLDGESFFRGTDIPELVSW